MRIHDGGGTSRTVKVDQYNKLQTHGVSVTDGHFINETSGKFWSIAFQDVEVFAATQYVAYIKNTSTTEEYEISDVRLSTTYSGRICLEKVTGTASDFDTTIVPVSHNLGKNPGISLTTVSGSGIQGLSSGGILFFLQCDEKEKQTHLEVKDKIIIQPGQGFAVKMVPSSGAITGTISIFAESI